MAILRNTTKLLSPPNVVNITSVANPDATNLDASYSDPSKINLIPANSEVSTTDLLRLIQDLVYNDEQINSEAGALLPILNEGVFYTRDLKDIDQVSFFKDFQILDNPLTYPTDSFTLGNGLVKIQNSIVTFTSDKTFNVGTEFSNISNVNYFKTALIETKTDGTYAITESVETVDFPIIPTQSSRTNNTQIPLYYVVLQNQAGTTRIIYIQDIYEYVGFAQLRKHKDAVGFPHSVYSDNVFELFRNDIRNLVNADGKYLNILDAQSAATNIVDETNSDFNDILGEGIGFVPSSFASLVFSTPGTRYDIYSTEYELNNPITSDLPFPNFVEPDDSLVNSTNGWFYLNEIANNLLGNTTVDVKKLKLGVKVGEEGTEDLSIKVVRYTKLTHSGLTNGTFTADSATANTVTITGSPDFNNTDFTNDSGGSSQQIEAGDFIFVTSGSGRGITAKIQSKTATTLTFENNTSKTLDATTEFIIYKNGTMTNVSDLATVATADINSSTWDEFTLSGSDYKMIEFDFSGNPFSISVQTNYFILTKLNPVTIVASPKILLEDPSSPNTNTQNIFNIVSYETPGGEYPIDAGDTFLLKDRFGDLATTNADRSPFYGQNNWTVVARDLSDNRLEYYNSVGFDSLINSTECWVDVTKSRIAFNTATKPSELFANYVYLNVVGNETSTKEIYSQGLEQSLEDYLLDKFPDGNNIGLNYIKKLIGKESTNSFIRGGYNGIIFDDSEMDSGSSITLTNNSDLIIFPKEIASLVESVAGTFVGWDFEYVVGTGSVDYPEFKYYKKNNYWIKLTFTYNVNNNISTVKFNMSEDSGSTYVTLGTLSLNYSGTKLTSGDWT